MSISIGVKIWLTLAVLFPVAIGVIYIDDGDTILSSIAFTEMLSFFAFSFYIVIKLIWSM
jgi:hypothetical protein